MTEPTVKQLQFVISIQEQLIETQNRQVAATCRLVSAELKLKNSTIQSHEFHIQELIEMLHVKSECLKALQINNEIWMKTFITTQEIEKKSLQRKIELLNSENTFLKRCIPENRVQY